MAKAEKQVTEADLRAIEERRRAEQVRERAKREREKRARRPLVAARRLRPPRLGHLRRVLRHHAARVPALGVPARPLPAADELQGRVPDGLHDRRGQREVQEGPPRLDHPQRRGLLRAVRQVHAPRLHAALAHGREQVQVPVPRQRLLQDRHQLRGSGAAAARAPAHHARRGRPARHRQGRQVPLREGRLGQARAPSRTRRRGHRSTWQWDEHQAAGHRVAGLAVDLPPRLRRHAAQPHPDGVGQRVAAPAPVEGAPARDAACASPGAWAASPSSCSSSRS